MPAGPGGLVCQKCRSGLCFEGNRWCQLCSCGSTLSELARVRFNFASHRALAEEVAYQAVRQVQGVIELDKQTNSQVTSLSDRLANSKRRLAEVEAVANTATPKSAGKRPEPHRAAEREAEGGRERGPVKDEEPDFGEEESFEEYSEEEEVEAEDTVAEPVDKRPADRPAGHEPPPEPAHPPRRSPARREERARSRSRNRGRRGGTRHKQGYRALQDPHSVFGRPSGAERIKKKKGPRGGRSHQ